MYAVQAQKHERILKNKIIISCEYYFRTVPNGEIL